MLLHKHSPEQVKQGPLVLDLNNVDEDLKETQVIILAPTRELADQTFKVITELSYTKVTSCKVIGGTRVQDGIQELRKTSCYSRDTWAHIRYVTKETHLYRTY